MSIFKPLSKNATKADYLMSLLLISWLLTGCASAPQTATPDVAALSTAAVATVYANLTLSPVSTPTPSPTPLPPTITDKFDVPMVLIPSGPLLMSRGETADEKPELEVMIGSYYIDTYEVTNQRYMACVEAGVCQPPYNQGSYTHASYYLNPDFANYPVLLPGLDLLDAYCGWRGAHLPSEIEWEKALRGPDARQYPWGNADPDGTRANLCDVNCYESYASKWLDDGYADVAPVGSFPAGASPYGVMDLVGNVNEKVMISPELLGPGYIYKTVGGAFDTYTSSILSNIRNLSSNYASAWFNSGFRCASGPVGEPVSLVVKPLRSTVTPMPTSTPLPTATIVPAAISGKVYPIAFISPAEDENIRLQLVNDDGSGLRTLFPVDAGQLVRAIYDPTWSPDGKSIYFIAELRELVDGHSRFLYQVAPFETNPEKQAYHAIEGLPNLDYDRLVLSPDGRYLALIYTPHPGEEAYLGAGAYEYQTLGLFNLQTRAWKTISIPNFDQSASEICLSPDGWSPNSPAFTFTASVNATSAQNQNGLAFISSHQGAGGVGADLFIANASGVVKKLIRVSDGDVPSPCPVWTAAGKQIIFVGQAVSGYRNLMTIRPNGSLFTPLSEYIASDAPWLVQLSPNRQHLAIAFTGDSGTELWHQAVNRDGIFMDTQNDVIAGTYLPWEFVGQLDDSSSLAWSPDNRRIAFKCNDKKSICTVNLDGSESFNLTAGLPPGYQPIWSPDGLKIAYVAEAQGKFTLTVMNIDGSGRRTLVIDLGQDAKWQANYRWSPQAVAP